MGDEDETMALSKERKSKLEKAGFKVGTVQEFLGLSDAEMMIIGVALICRASWTTPNPLPQPL